MKYICPLITVMDIDHSREFYEKVMNQKVKLDMGENVSFEGDFAIHLKSHFSDLIQPKSIKTGGNNFELYFEENDLDELVDRLMHNNVEFVHPLREQPWRQKVVRIYDPDQNIIEIGESMEHVAFRLFLEGLSEKRISEITYLPINQVKKAINDFSTEE